MRRRNDKLELPPKQDLESVAVEVAVPEVAVEEPKIDFDTWFIVRKSVIPGHHHREIIKADFLGRKVPMQATIKEFDDALAKYGIKLP
jgi:hypothetical protein